ncbi:30846_t:CDS:2, partial [Racocetra persica]
MSKILSTITGVLGQLFGNLLPSWGDPMPLELPELSELPEPEEGIEDLAPKRLVETRRISDQDLCINHLAIIPETYLYQEDPLAMFENVEDQISNVYRRELAQLG